MTTTTEEAKIEEKKSEDTAATGTLAAVAERLEFFFSDANIRQDFFIRKYLLGSDKMVPVEALLRFNTIKKHTTSPDTVVEAAKTLPDKLIVSEDGKAIGTVEPFALAKMDDNLPLTLHVSNLPVNDDKYTVGTDDIRALFASDIALVKLRFRRPPTEKNDGEDDAELEPSKQQGEGRSPGKGRRVPMGAALVEFKNIEGLEKEAAEVLTHKNGEKVEAKRELKLGDNVLQVMLLKDYIDARKKQKPEAITQEEDEQQFEDKDEGTMKATPNKVFTFDWKPGCVIRIKGVADDCDREAILDAVAGGLDTTVEKVKEQNIYVDFSRGQKDGAIRFATFSDSIKPLCDKLASGEIMIKDAKVESAAILEGGEEKEYWDKFIEFKQKQQLKRHAEERSFSRRKKSRRS